MILMKAYISSKHCSIRTRLITTNIRQELFQLRREMQQKQDAKGTNVRACSPSQEEFHCFSIGNKREPFAGIKQRMFRAREEVKGMLDSPPVGPPLEPIIQ